jgi:hypothetical protein
MTGIRQCQLRDTRGVKCAEEGDRGWGSRRSHGENKSPPKTESAIAMARQQERASVRRPWGLNVTSSRRKPEIGDGSGEPREPGDQGQRAAATLGDDGPYYVKNPVVKPRPIGSISLNLLDAILKIENLAVEIVQHQAQYDAMERIQQPSRPSDGLRLARLILRIALSLTYPLAARNQLSRCSFLSFPRLSNHSEARSRLAPSLCLVKGDKNSPGSLDPMFMLHFPSFEFLVFCYLTSTSLLSTSHHDRSKISLTLPGESVLRPFQLDLV